MNKYIQLIEECNKNRGQIVEFTIKKDEYMRNIKGVMIGNRFYTLSEYERIQKQENDINKYIEELQQTIEKSC